MTKAIFIKLCITLIFHTITLSSCHDQKSGSDRIENKYKPEISIPDKYQFIIDVDSISMEGIGLDNNLVKESMDDVLIIRSYCDSKMYNYIVKDGSQGGIYCEVRKTDQIMSDKFTVIGESLINKENFSFELFDSILQNQSFFELPFIDTNMLEKGIPLDLILILEAKVNNQYNKIIRLGGYIENTPNYDLNIFKEIYESLPYPCPPLLYLNFSCKEYYKRDTL